MVTASIKQAKSKGHFRHESQMGRAIGLCTTMAYVHRQHLREKNDAVYGLLFLLRDLADLRVTNPTRNPLVQPCIAKMKYQQTKFVLNHPIK